MSSAERARRIISALDDLVGQEAVLLRSMDLVEALQITERCSPLVEELCRLASESTESQLQESVAALLLKRQQNATLLEAHLQRVQAEIRKIEDARRKLGRMAPVYRRSDSARSIVEPNLNTAA